jgi:hypothetical protein
MQVCTDCGMSFRLGAGGQKRDGETYCNSCLPEEEE